MKVICNRKSLLDAVAAVGSAVASRTPTPVLQCVKLSAAEGVLTLAATDLEVGLRKGVEQVEVEDAGEALIPADKITQIVRASDDPTLTIETDDHTLHIKGEDSHFKVFGHDPKEAPEVRGFDGDNLDCQIEAGVLHSLVARTLFAAAAEHGRYAINGVLFERDGKMVRMVATDGRRLAVARGQCSSGEGKKTCILPIKALNLLNRLAGGIEATVSVVVEDNQALFCVGEGAEAAILSSNLVEGQFPPFEDVVPKDQDKRVTLNAQALNSALRRAALLTNEESKGVRLSFAQEQLTITSLAPEMGEAEICLAPARYEGDPLEISFNSGFITDALKVIDDAEIIIELKASNKPGVIRAGNDFAYVLMPVNLT